MAARLRAAIGAAARRLVSEELRVLLRGSKPNPPAAQPPAEEVATARGLVLEEQALMKSVAGGRRGSKSRYARRHTRVKKKEDFLSSKLISWVVGTFVTISYLEGYEAGKAKDEKDE